MRKILILGASGLIGSTLTKFLAKQSELEVHAASRNCSPLAFLNKHDCDMSHQRLAELVAEIRPAFVVNCVGLTKHLASESSDAYLFPNLIVPLNLQRLKKQYNFALFHISSDCVFSGTNAPYSDCDEPDANDNYATTKAIAESLLKTDAMILRTSTVGHEINSRNGLVDWFLGQTGKVEGYKHAYFNGVTTLTLAKLLHNLISAPNGYQKGVYNVASERISKFDFLHILKNVYEFDIDILPNEYVEIDRSLVQSQHIDEFITHSDWRVQVRDMKDDYDRRFT